MFELATPITVGLSCLTGVVWAIRLEGKVNAHSQLFEEREKQSEARIVADAERHEELKDHLVRIEGKLDTLAYGALHQVAQKLNG